MLLTLKAVYLYFNSPLHVGQVGVTLEETDYMLRSDTLFSALLWGAYYIGGERYLNILKDSFLNENIKISSSFPFLKTKDGLKLFFPKPLLPIKMIVKEYIEDIKNLKKAKFFTQILFEKILNGEQISNEDVNKIRENLEELKKYVRLRTIPRVVLDRVNASSMLYHVTGLYFSCFEDVSSGMYFLIDIRDKDVYEIFKASLSILSEHGIGGERTYGWGLFSFEEGKIELNVPDEPNAFISLSLVHPENNEWSVIKDSPSYYNIIPRGGWTRDIKTNKDYRRKTVIMLEEGSIFSEQIRGSIVDVTPRDLSNLKVLRYGKAFLLPIKLIGD